MDTDTDLEGDYADLIEGYQANANRLNAAIDALIAVVHQIDPYHWPTVGWDYSTTISHLEDIRPNRRADELLQWAADELLEREFK